MDKIASIRPDVVISEGKQSMLDYVANMYDEIASRQPDNEPVAIVFALVTMVGGGSSGYLTVSAVDDRNSLYISRGISMLEHDAVQWDDTGWPSA